MFTLSAREQVLVKRWDWESWRWKSHVPAVVSHWKGVRLGVWRVGPSSQHTLLPPFILGTQLSDRTHGGAPGTQAWSGDVGWLLQFPEPPSPHLYVKDYNSCLMTSQAPNEPCVWRYNLHPDVSCREAVLLKGGERGAWSWGPGLVVSLSSRTFSNPLMCTRLS